jgi:hypothetical protein
VCALVSIWVFNRFAYRDKKCIVFVRFSCITSLDMDQIHNFELSKMRLTFDSSKLESSKTN